MENKENNMNLANTANSLEDVVLDLDAFLMSLISHLYDAYGTESESESESEPDSDSDSVSVSESESESTSIFDFDSELDSGSDSDSHNFVPGREMTIEEFLDLGSNSSSESSDSMPDRMTKIFGFCDQRIISQFYHVLIFLYQFVENSTIQ